MNPILVIGGTGRIGRQVLSQLSAKGAQVRAMARNPGAARLPPQVEVVPRDLALPETLDSCLSGIDTVFLVWTAPAASVAPALERIAKHARRIVFLSAPLKTAHPLFQQLSPGRAMVEQVERLIETSGLQWTILRPGMFAANALSCWAPQIRAGDVVRWPYLAAPTAPIDERDIAAVTVRTLCEEGHAGAEYVLTAPIVDSVRAAILNQPCDWALAAYRRDFAGRGASGTAPSDASGHREYAAQCVGGRTRPARVRHINGCRDHGSSAASLR
jgi:uncharacterized protein YbjT (DUF2867 family)